MLDEKSFMRFADELRKKIGFDMSGYKVERMKRRVDLLMRKYEFEDYMEYLNLMIGDPARQKEFFDRITINVTEFFRNPERWDRYGSYISELMSKSSGGTLWSAGCATGEEPYSMGIMLEELHAPSGFRILASDLDSRALETAGRGVYESQALKNVKAPILSKYFTKIDETHYAISEKVKRRITFKRQNILGDSFEKDLTSILCRNVVIYFEMDAKEKLYEHFAASLKKGGILFVGGTERIFNSRKIGLEPVEPFFYRKL